MAIACFMSCNVSQATEAPSGCLLTSRQRVRIVSLTEFDDFYDVLGDVDQWEHGKREMWHFGEAVTV